MARARVLRVISTIAEGFFLPWCTQVVRSPLCSSTLQFCFLAGVFLWRQTAVLIHVLVDGAVEWATGVTCWSFQHILLVAIAGGSALLMAVALPLTMTVLIRKALVTPRTQDHEKYLRLKETEYVVELDNEWATQHFHLFSSFKRRSVYHRPFRLMMHAAFVCCMTYLSDSSMVLYQAGSMAGILMLYLLYAAAIMPYRVLSSSFVMHCLGWCVHFAEHRCVELTVSILHRRALVIDCGFGCLLAAKIQSPLLQSSVLTVWLLFFNALCMFLAFVSVFFLVIKLFQKKRMQSVLFLRLILCRSLDCIL